MDQSLTMLPLNGKLLLKFPPRGTGPITRLRRRRACLVSLLESEEAARWPYLWLDLLNNLFYRSSANTSGSRG
jgi:hypothetical protein